MNGGTLETKTVTYGDGAADATFTFNGGTLKALQAGTLIESKPKLTVNVASNGGIVDLNGKTVAINEPLLEDAGSTGGGMTFRGGGIVTLAAGNTYAGKTTVEIGTSVRVAAPGEIGGGLVVIVPETAPADGFYTLVAIDGAGTFTDAVLTGVVPPANATLRLSEDRKSVLCIYGNPPNTWVGGATGSLGDAANWSLGSVPAAGESCIIGNVTAASLTNPSGSAFAPASITFPADTALVTISGESAISGITAIVNNATLHHVFECPVVCADNITPDITRGSENYMTFAGGITMHDAPKTGDSVSDYWSGNVTITTDEWQYYTSAGSKNWVEIVPDTTFTFDKGCIDRMNIYSGATVVANRLVYNGCARKSTKGSTTGWFSLVFGGGNGNGVLRVGEISTVSDAVLFHSWAGDDMLGGTIIADKLTCATTKKTGGNFPYPVFMLNCGGLSGGSIATDSFNGEGVWAIGPGGLSFPDSEIYAGAHFETSIGKSLGGRPAATLHSFADWALKAHPNGRNICAFQIGKNNGGFLVIDTSHYAIGDPAYDTATSHTVTLDGMVTVGPMRVEGTGKVVFANEYNTFSGLTVAGTATASVRAGCKPGVGTVSVDAGATLEVAQSGTATLGDALTLAEGAALAFNFTDLDTPPVLAGTAVNAGTVNVKISAPADGVPEPAFFTLTSGLDFTGAKVNLLDAPRWADSVYVRNGNLVLRVKKGTAVFVR